ncbi:MAG: NAD(P)-dependent oxidoreductase [Nitrospiraceae bacterium]|nr:MAG: NAD(P)-dependent oxidoreductase [Nitrospiraceae bacterium]
MEKQKERKKKLLVTGVSGFLGWNLCRTAQQEWDVWGTWCTHPVIAPGATFVQVDLTDFRRLKRIMGDIGPDAVIHTAANSRPDYCEQHRAETQRINVDAALILAKLCADRSIPFAFTSTDLVFDGLRPPYGEHAPVSPVNVYGEQKARAEEHVLKAYPEAAVCRMPLMFGDPGPAASSFFMSMVAALREGRELKLFVDEFRTPVSGRTAAEGLLLALVKTQGLLHLGGAERISRFCFGLLLMDALGIREARMMQCRQADVATAARRAPDVSLDSARAFALGFRPGTLRDQLRECVHVISRSPHAG